MRNRQFIYTRVSTDKQTNENQIDLLKEKYPGATLVQDVSSGVGTRKNLRKLMSEWRRGDEVIVYKLDRISRGVLDFNLIIERAKKDRVTLTFHSEAIDPSTTEGRLMMNMVVAFAQHEREMISQRTKLGLERAKKEGKKLGGYRGEGGKKQRIDLSGTELMFLKKMRDKGLTWASIGILFNERFSKKYKHDTVRKRFQSEYFKRF